MFKFILAFLLTVSYLSANDKVEVYATQMDTQGNIVKASGEVIVIYQDYHLSAKRAVYDRNSGELELFGNIRATQGDSISVLGDYARLNIGQKERTFKPFFMLEKKSNVWLSGAKSFSKDKDVEIESGIMSGCNPNDPLWKMEFSSSDYNSDTKWLNLYNTKIYIYDIPVFYTPYFGYSLDTTRRTGLLPPMIGYSQSEGFYYEQALFIAEQNWWDLELKPQVRTNRGEGIYSTFRFVDSKVSKGELSLGYFKEKQDYVIDKELANDSHYGFNFKYDNSDFLNQWLGLNLDGQSGIYADITNMNDVEYINLSTNDTTQNATTTQILSRINLFYNTDNNYFGAYFKHYKDLTLDSNDNTLQNLPAIQYHSYLDTFLDDHLLYSFDVRSNNYYRKLGKSAIQTDINIPITLQTSLFDEYLNVAYKPYLYAQHTSFKGDAELGDPFLNEYNDGYFGRIHHIFAASTQLTRAYDELTHVVEFGSQYTVDGSDTADGYYEEQLDYCSIETNQNNSICEFYNISEIEENVQFYFSQYIYGDDGKQIIYHRLAQSISYEKINGGAGELENELDYQITDNISFYNNMFYNYDENDFSKNFNRISYNDKSFDFSISHMYRNNFSLLESNDAKYTSYITSRLEYKYNKHYSYLVRLDYDLERSEKKSAEVGFLYKKRCWDFGLRYVENNRPILDINGASSSIYDRYIYLTIALKPIMTSENKNSGFAYKLPDSSKGN
ncbi:MAG: LPS assembly protein LptD [Sulfurimonas sp.]|nr:LPS assembly protein LptD [Sulfurimonas sp.]